MKRWNGWFRSYTKVKNVICGVSRVTEPGIWDVNFSKLMFRNKIINTF